MVDISMEILASSVGIRTGYKAKYRVKSWWAHVEVPPNITAIELPRLPMIQQYLVMTGKDTTLFIETWEEEEMTSNQSGRRDFRQGQDVPDRQFIGMTTCTVDEQLKNHNLNPSVQWLDVHDPIEDVVKGKLLLKVDAKFALTTTNGTNEKRLENNHEASPPRHSFPPSIDQGFSPPVKQSAVSSQISSKKSEGSLISSVGSATSSRSQEQGIQTDVSLPVLPDISKYTRALKSQITNNEYDEQEKQFTRRSNAPPSAGIYNPLQHAQHILLKESSLGKLRRSSEPVTGKPPIPSNIGRRNCLVRQNQQRLSAREVRFNRFDFENIEDVIDVLNEGADSVFSPPVAFPSTSKGNYNISSKPNQGNGYVKVKQNSSDERISLHREGSGGSETNYVERALDERYELQKRRQHSEGTKVPQFCSNNNNVGEELGIGGKGNKVNKDAPSAANNVGTFSGSNSSNRFKEIHFDGALAQQQASNILRKSASNSESNSNNSYPNPPVMRRRIAAAIFDD